MADEKVLDIFPVPVSSPRDPVGSRAVKTYIFMSIKKTCDEINWFQVNKETENKRLLLVLIVVLIHNYQTYEIFTNVVSI